ncbi:MAG TPA: hypothetical protein HA329_04965 [Candidatus Thalassarchaeaceae archaeon]|nr:hypothetical protein [Candidatus Thalassarchaeaceae archaeon]
MVPSPQPSFHVPWATNILSVSVKENVRVSQSIGGTGLSDEAMRGARTKKAFNASGHKVV